MVSDPPRRVVPLRPVEDVALSACSGAEPFALIVLGDSMAPEFHEGDVIVIEPEGLATDGAYVLAHVDGEWIFRQLRGDGRAWRLVALDARCPEIPIPDLAPVRGVVIQRSRPGRRSQTRHYGR